MWATVAGGRLGAQMRLSAHMRVDAVQREAVDRRAITMQLRMALEENLKLKQANAHLVRKADELEGTVREHSVPISVPVEHL